MSGNVIAFTTGVPVEVILAAGCRPLDLNNVFITGQAGRYVSRAEAAGFPANICAWIKGLYQVAQEINPRAIIGVVQGDCSNTHSLIQLWQNDGLTVLPFSYPWDKNPAQLDREIAALEHFFGVERAATLACKNRLDKIRHKLVELDRLTWQENKVSGAENHYWLVNSSDFGGDPDIYEQELDAFLAQAYKREPKDGLRLAYLGVPPVFSDLYPVLDELGARVVFNEVQRQFAMPEPGNSIVEQYLAYTYPYQISDRLADILPELQRRRVQGVVAYSQAFCHRQLDRIFWKKRINLPLLSLEGDLPVPVDERTRIRLEAFLDILAQQS